MKDRALTVQVISRAADLNNLEDWGTVTSPISQPPCRLSGMSVAIPGAETMRSGVWECSPGQYRRDVKEAEVMHFIAARLLSHRTAASPFRSSPASRCSARL
jgi:uncharacterized cupin superfamily protein